MATTNLLRTDDRSAQIAERQLDDAILNADIRRRFEEYLEIADQFYADEIVVTSEASVSPVREKDAVRSLLAVFLLPLHIMAEIGGMRTVVRVQPIVGNSLNETHAAWTVDLAGVSDKTCTLQWRTQPKREGSHVVSEHHCDEQRMGEPLTLEDLNSLLRTVAARRVGRNVRFAARPCCFANTQRSGAERNLEAIGFTALGGIPKANAIPVASAAQGGVG